MYPCSDVRQVGSRGIVQDTLSEFLGVLGDEVLRNVCDGSVAEGAPGIGRGSSGHAGQDCRLEVDHIDR